MTNDERNPKPECRTPTEFCPSSFVLGHSFVIRASSFGFRVAGAVLVASGQEILYNRCSHGGFLGVPPRDDDPVVDPLLGGSRILFLDDDPERAAVFLAECPAAVWVQTA